MRHIVVGVLVAMLASPSLGLAATITMDKAEFITMLANVDLLKQRLANADQQITLHIKGRGERDKIIRLQQEQIKELEGMIADYQARGESAERLIAALEEKAQASSWLTPTSAFVLGLIAAAVVFVLVN